MQQHVLDDGIGAFAMLHDFFEIGFEHLRELADLLLDLFGQLRRLQHLVEFVGELDGQRGEIVDEIERILDLVGDSGRELAEGGQLLSLDQAVLRSAQIVERFGQLACSGLHTFEQPYVLDRNHRLISEGRDRVI
jgi:hypothetical protein